MLFLTIGSVRFGGSPLKEATILTSPEGSSANDTIPEATTGKAEGTATIRASPVKGLGTPAEAAKLEVNPAGGAVIPITPSA